MYIFSPLAIDRNCNASSVRVPFRLLIPLALVVLFLLLLSVHHNCLLLPHVNFVISLDVYSQSVSSSFSSFGCLLFSLFFAFFHLHHLLRLLVVSI